MSETTPAARDTGVVEGAPTGAAAAGAAAPASTVQKLRCMICGEREATFVQQFGPNPAGKMLKLRFCDTCTPSFVNRENDGVNGKADKPKRKKTKNRIATTDYTEPVSAFLYRLGGCTLEQAGRWLWLYLPDNFDTEEAAREAAGRTLRVMREQGQVEVISTRRLWLGDLKRHGRRENFFRLAKARAGAAIIEGAVAADEDPAKALKAYGRPWKSGGIDHCSHRADLYLLMAEVASGRDDVVVDPEVMHSETYRDFQFFGAKLPELDNGGEKLKLKVNARRKYEEVTPDGEFLAEFLHPSGTGWLSCPFLLELERRTNAGKVEEKLQKIAGYWLRHLEKFKENRIRPIIVVHHDTREARVKGRKEGTGVIRMVDSLHELLFKRKGHFKDLDAYLRKHYQTDEYELGRFVLLTEWDWVYDWTDPFGVRYLPLSPYPAEGDIASHVKENGALVDLTAATIEHTWLATTVAAKHKRTA